MGTSVSEKVRKSGVAWLVDFAIDHWVPIVTAAGGGLATYLTYVTAALKTYAPVSYYFAFLLAALVLMLLYAAYQRAQMWLADRRVRQLMSFPPTSVNPLRSHFEDELVRVADFIYPVPGPFMGKSFIRCQIIGPGSISIMKGTSMTVLHDQTRFLACDIVNVSADETIHGGAAFEQCTFADCTFINVTIFVPPSMANQLHERSRIQVLGLAGRSADGFQ